MATPGKVGRVLVQSKTPPVLFTDEPATADTAKKRFVITDSTKRYWDRNTPVTVKVGGVAQTKGFQIEYPGGVVVFDAAQTGAVTVSGKYVTMEQLAGFFNWSLTVGTKTIDSTSFESGDWEEFAVSTKNFKATAEKFWASGADFTSRIGTEILLVLFTDFGKNTRFEGYGVMESDAVSVPANELIKDRLDFIGKQGIYFRQS